MRLAKAFLFVMVLVVLAIIAIAQGTPGQANQGAQMPGFDIKSLDKTVEPCVDFYRFACGTWMANNPVPADQSRWGRFNELEERNRLILRDILEKAALPDPKRSAASSAMAYNFAWTASASSAYPNIFWAVCLSALACSTIGGYISLYS